jgi:1-deoxy-D-xylulose-5-phosphate reductoisomerase
LKVKTLALLGSTGSIGTQALDVCGALGVKITALAAGRNVKLAEEQVRRFMPRTAAMADEAAARDLKQRVRDLDVKVLSGAQGVCEAAREGADMTLNAVAGVAGLEPTLAAIEAGRTLALANKESLVAGGGLVTNAARRHGVKIIPVDSEHSAIFQCLQGCADAGAELERIILTASGGPFFGMGREQLRHVTAAQALRHPNWSMGPQITINCATMMNKGMEFIEAAWLFGLKPDKIKVVIQRESVIHSAVEFARRRGDSAARRAGYAHTHPVRADVARSALPSPAAPLDLFKTRCRRCISRRPDEDTFKLPARMPRRRFKERTARSRRGERRRTRRRWSYSLKDRIGFTDIGLTSWRRPPQRQDAAQGQAQTPGEAFMQADATARRRFVRERTRTGV